MSIEVKEVPTPNQVAALLDTLERLQAAHRHYAYCDNDEASEAADAVDEIEMELGELLLPFDLGILRPA